MTTPRPTVGAVVEGCAQWAGDGPRVSVVVPDYNYERFMRQRLDSILNQTYQDFELIYLDDASKDAGRDVFKGYLGDPRLRGYYNEVNSGSVFRQWNKGVSCARGELVWIAEADDYAEPDFLERMVSIFDTEPGVGLAYAQSWRVEDERKTSNLSWTDCLSPERWRHDFVGDGREECAKYLIYRNTIPNASAVVFDRRRYLDGGGAPNDFRMVGDWMAWARILRTSRIGYVAEHLNYFRTHPNTARAAACASYDDVAEKYEVLGFIVRRCDVQPATAADALVEMANEVLRRLLPDGSRGKLQKLALLATIACKVWRTDPSFLSRCVRGIHAYRRP